MPRRLFIAFISTFILSGCLSSVDTKGTFAPKPEIYSDSVIQVYAARTKGKKKALAVHTWISVKPRGALHYTSYEIIGWRLRRYESALVTRTNMPDRDWWGHQPQLLLDVRGAKAEQLIPKIEQAVASYPYASTYTAWPGPNSNTFTAYVGKQVPELGLDLPSTAIGKDYRPINQVAGLSPSGSGVQFSLWGLLGLTFGYEEGVELNLLGLNLELDLFDLALELPGIGRIGLPEASPDNESETVQNTAQSPRPAVSDQ